VSTASVACGVLGVGGNKGAVAVGFTLHRRKFAVVCSHFAAHQVRAYCVRSHAALFMSKALLLDRLLLYKMLTLRLFACLDVPASLGPSSETTHHPVNRMLQAGTEARNANYAHIAGSLSFSKRQWLEVESLLPRNASPLKVAKGQAAVAARADSSEDLTHPADHSGSEQGGDEEAEEEFQVRSTHEHWPIPRTLTAPAQVTSRHCIELR